MKEEKRYKISITYFNPRTMEITAWEECRTKPMTKTRFKQVLKNRLKGLKNYCYQVR